MLWFVEHNFQFWNARWLSMKTLTFTKPQKNLFKSKKSSRHGIIIFNMPIWDSDLPLFVLHDFLDLCHKSCGVHSYTLRKLVAISFPFALNGIWSWWQFSFRFRFKWISIWFKIERKTVTTIRSHSIWKEMEY